MGGEAYYGMSTTDALAHLDDALDALTTEGWRVDAATGAETRMPAIEATIAVDLERIDMAIGPKGTSMFATLAEEIKRAVIAIEAARQSLSAAHG